MVWIQIRANILLALIWVQTVWKGCQQTTKVVVSKERVGHTQNIVLSEWYFLLGQMLKKFEHVLPAKKA